MSYTGRIATYLVILSAIILLLVPQTLAQSIIVKDENGLELPFNSVIDAGQELTIEYKVPPNTLYRTYTRQDDIFFYEVPRFIRDDSDSRSPFARRTLDEAKTIEQTYRADVTYETSAAIRISFGLEIAPTEAEETFNRPWDGEDERFTRVDVVERFDIWMVNQIRSANTNISLSEIDPNGQAVVSLNVPVTAFWPAYGQSQSGPQDTAKPIVDLMWQRLAGNAPDGSRWSLSEPKFESSIDGLQPGDNQLTVDVPKVPGLYSLNVVRDGWVIDSKQISIPNPPPVVSKGETDPGIWARYDFEITSEARPGVQRGHPVQIEFKKRDRPGGASVGSFELFRLTQSRYADGYNILVLDPSIPYQGCVADASDIRSIYGRSVRFENTSEISDWSSPPDDEVDAVTYEARIPTENFSPGSYQYAIITRHESETGGPAAPIMALGQFTVLPNANGPKFSLSPYSQTGDGADRGQAFEVSGPETLSTGSQRVRWRNGAGAVQIDSIGIVERLADRDFPLRLLEGRGTTIFSVGRQECYLDGACFYEVLDSNDTLSATSGLRQNLPAPIARRLDLVQPETVAQTWPLRAEPAQLCGKTPTPPDESEGPAYTPPPLMAMALYAETSTPAPYTYETFIFRVENRGETDATNVKARLRVVDSNAHKPLEQVKYDENHCDLINETTFECELGVIAASETSDVHFEAEIPRTGQVYWESALQSPGDLAGEVTSGGFIGAGRQPLIDTAFVMQDQMAIIEGGLVAYRHPTSDRNASNNRRIFVVGKHLSDVPIWRSLPSDDPKINYTVEARSGSERATELPLLVSGYKKLFQMSDGQAALARAEREGFEAIMVSASFEDDVLPGRRSFKVDGATVNWSLKFGDVAADVRYVRKVGERYEAIEHAFQPETLYVQATLSHALPLDQVIAQIVRPDPLTGKALQEKLPLKPVGGTQNRVFRSGPLDLHHASGTIWNSDAKSIPFKPDDTGEMAMAVGLESAFASKYLEVTVGEIETAITVKSSPARGEYSYLWKDALGKAASCHPEYLEKRLNDVSGDVSEEFTNYFFIVGENWSETQTAQIGHHAAAILLRDKFLEMSIGFDKTMEKALTDDKALIAYHVLLARQRYDQLENPIYKLPVVGENGQEVEFWQTLVSSRSYVDRSSFFIKDLTRLEDWRKDATRSLIRQQLKASAETRKAATELGSCETEDLLKFVGFNFEPVIRQLKPELMTLVTRQENGQFRSIWLEDVSARAWVDLVAKLADDLVRQQKNAQTDTTIALTIGGILLAPVGAFAETGTTLWYISIGLELTDIALNAWHEYKQYAQSEQELTFSRGAINVIGYERFNKATAAEYGIANVIFGVGLPIVGIVPEAVNIYRVYSGSKIAKGLNAATEIAQLSEDEARHLAVFASYAEGRRASIGVDALNPTQRKIVDWFDKARTTNKPLRVDLQDPAELARADAAARGDFEVPRSRPDFDAPPIPPTISPARRASDVTNATETRLPSQEIKFRNPDGTQNTISVGERIAGGASSEVFQHPEFPDKVIRITFKRETGAPGLLDDYGDRVLETIGSEHIRSASKEIVPVSTRGNVERIAIVEKLEPAYKTVGKQWDELASTASEARRNMAFDMRAAQAEAYVGAIEDLNARGFVWLDDKPDNFAFVPLKDGSGRVEVVVLDPGGIFPISAQAAASRGLSQAELAQQIQRQANGSFELYFPGYSGADDMVARARHRQRVIAQRYSDSFDYAELGISGPEELAFLPYSGERFPYLAPFFDNAEISSELLETQRFRTFVPPGAKDTGFGEVLDFTDTRRFQDFVAPGEIDSSLLNSGRFEPPAPPAQFDSALNTPFPNTPNPNAGVPASPFDGFASAPRSSRAVSAPSEGWSSFHPQSGAPLTPGGVRDLKIIDANGVEDTLNFNTSIVGQGAFNTIVGLGNGQVARLPYGRAVGDADLARTADRGGRTLFNEAFSGTDMANADVRLVELKREVTLATDKGIPQLSEFVEAGSMPKGSVIQILEERAPFSSTLGSADRPAAFRNAMTDAEALAYDQAHRALNEQGMVWLDNKIDNFAFEPHPTPSFPGQQRLVILDTGGLIAMKGRSSELAARMQSYINGGGPDVFRRGYMEVPENFRWPSKRELLLNEFGDQMDMQSVGLRPSDMEDFDFNPMSVEDFNKARALSQLSDKEAREFAQTYARFRRAGLSRE